MGVIYKIVNDVNDKVYIGQTAGSMVERYKQHLKNVNQKRHQEKLYQAMREIGVEHFHQELIEEANEKELDEKERYWIRFYDSLKNGYNMTCGGNGGSIYDIDNKQLEELWDEGLTIRQISEKIGIPTNVIQYRLKNYKNYSREESYDRAVSKPVYCYDIFGLYLGSFNSAAKAERAMRVNRKESNCNIDACARGEQKTAYGLVWRYDYVEEGEDIHDLPFLMVPINQYTKDGQFLKTYPSIRHAIRAMKELGYRHPHIDEVCKRKANYKTAAGYVWRYYYDPFDKLPDNEVTSLASLLDD